MKKNHRFLSLIVFAAVMLGPLLANAQPTINWPFAFSDWFPNKARHAGFTTGIKLTLGADIIPSDGCTITTATATNRISGKIYNLTYTPIPAFAQNNWQVVPVPQLDPEIHLGDWKIYVEEYCPSDDLYYDADAWTPVLHAEEVMPCVRGLRASVDPENPLTPTIKWKRPSDNRIPDFCNPTKLRNNLRLLTDPNDQFHRSPHCFDPECSYIIPEGLLTPELIPLTWVRIEFRCYDNDGLELRSNTFKHLQDLLGDANGL